MKAYSLFLQEIIWEMKLKLSVKFLAILALGMLWSCGGSESGKSDSDESSDTEQKETSICVSDYKDKPDKLLTKAMVEAYANGKMIEKAQNNILGVQVNYSWESDQKGMIELPNGIKIENNLNCEIILKNIKLLEVADPKADFKQQFRNIEGKEKEDLISKTKEKIDEKEDMSDDKKGMAKGFANMIGKTHYEEVSGVGEMATWQTIDMKMVSKSTGTLIVQNGKERFELEVDMAESNEKSKSVAIELAKKILENCH